MKDASPQWHPPQSPLIKRGGHRPAVILPVVLFVLALIGLLAAMFSFRVNADLSATQAVAMRMQTRLAAEAGIEYARMVLRTSRFDRTVWYNNPNIFNRIIVKAHGHDAKTAGTNQEFEENMVYRFSIVADDPTDDKDYIRFGLTDEASKLNLNAATEAQLLALVKSAIGEKSELNPQDFVDAILDWRDEDGDPRGEAGDTERTYYSNLPKPYRVKNGPFDSVEELLLVKGITPAILYGEDFDRNGLITENEKDGDRSFPEDNQDEVLNRGLYGYLTVVSKENNVANDNRPRVYLAGEEELVRAELMEIFPDEPGTVEYIVKAAKTPPAGGGGGQGGGRGGQQGQQRPKGQQEQGVSGGQQSGEGAGQQQGEQVGGQGAARGQIGQQGGAQTAGQGGQAGGAGGGKAGTKLPKKEKQSTASQKPKNPAGTRGGDSGPPKPPGSAGQTGGATGSQPPGQDGQEQVGGQTGGELQQGQGGQQQTGGQGEQGGQGQQSGPGEQGSEGDQSPKTPQGGEEGAEGGEGQQQENPPLTSPASLMLPRKADGQIMPSPLTLEHLALLMDRTTMVKPDQRTIAGLINVNTAPPAVLACVDGITDEHIQMIMAKRDQLDAATLSTTAWLVTEGVMDLITYERIAPAITARGQQFTIESVGYADYMGMVTRLQVVVDMNGPIAQTVYYRDISNLGGTYPIRESDKEKVRGH